jgi:MscS family membrane protein
MKMRMPGPGIVARASWQGYRDQRFVQDLPCNQSCPQPGGPVQLRTGTGALAKQRDRCQGDRGTAPPNGVIVNVMHALRTTILCLLRGRAAVAILLFCLCVTGASAQSGSRVAAGSGPLAAAGSGPAAAAEAGPLAVPDTSSPRAALQGFLATTDNIYASWAKLLTTYWDDGTLYPAPSLRADETQVMAQVPSALRVLDLSHISPVLRDTLGLERGLQLREILDRITLPSPSEIPDAAAMDKLASKRWRLPGTEIDFVQVTQGPRTGDYLVSPETVDRLPEFYRRVRDLPYRPGPSKDLEDAYQRFSPISHRTIYDLFSGSPIGLGPLIPLRWMLSWPDWTRFALGGATTWQWVAVGIGAIVGVLIILLSLRIATGLSRLPRHRWDSLALPIGILLVAGVLAPAVRMVTRLAGTPLTTIAVLETLALYLAYAWLALVGSVLVGEMIVGAGRLGIRSLDSQLVRLATRLFGAMIALFCLFRGADELGFPAYSVLAGLGVGGLAVALAAKDSLANLFGSLLIMFEKPFRVGHLVRIGATEGTVEDVGFRSTRIRTLDNSLVSIPNDSVINTTVENLSQRSKRRQRFTVSVTYDTPLVRLDAFVQGIIQVILDHPLTDKDAIQVTLNNLADSSLDILVIFHLKVLDYPAELRGRHEILVGIVALAENLGVAFAFPTRTLVVEPEKTTAPEGAAEPPGPASQRWLSAGRRAPQSGKAEAAP